MSNLTLVNPLGVTLRHYAEALEDNLRSAGFHPRTLTVTEPSFRPRSRMSRLGWVIDEVRILVRVALTRSDPVIWLWPSLGYWDQAALALAARHRSALVVHDPIPLVRAVGHGPAGRMIARISSPACRLIVHSVDAANAASQHGIETILIAHPVAAVSREPAQTREKRTIRVLGQYKADRDLATLKTIATHCQPNWELEIVGRGWPPISGWKVRDEFVPEQEFTRLILSSAVILIPYRRFFQSGVAIRALELNRPVVGPRESSLASLLGSDSPWLVDSNTSWIAGLRNAMEAGNHSAADRAADIRNTAISDWNDYVTTLLN